MSAKITYPRLDAALEKWAKEIEKRLKRQMRIDKTVASGRTERSIEGRREKNKITIYAEEAPGKNYSVLDIIDKGRSAGKKRPRVLDIMLWMEEKGVRPRKNGRIVAKTDKAMRDSAYLIARAIGERGTIRRFGWKGSNILNFAIQPIADEMTDDLFLSYRKDVEEYIEKNLDRDIIVK